MWDEHEYDDDDDELFFVVWLTDERRLALFPTETIVRDFHHRHDTLRAEFEPLFEF